MVLALKSPSFHRIPLDLGASPAYPSTSLLLRLLLTSALTLFPFRSLFPSLFLSPLILSPPSPPLPPHGLSTSLPSPIPLSMQLTLCSSL